MGLGIRTRYHGLRVRRLASAYFTDHELEHADIHGCRLQLCDARFDLRDGVLTVTQPPDDEWLRARIAQLTDEQALWEVVAFLKVRRLSTADEVAQRARSGELYDENYFTKRGGGAPYVGYPLELNGFRGEFPELAASVVRRHRPRCVLDVGCATGELVKAFAQAGVDAHGIDFSSWALEHRVIDSVVQGSALELPWPDATFDLVISTDFLEHVHPDDLPGVLAEQVRVLAPDGRILHLIPFYDSDPPEQVDAHLCQATEAWWMAFLGAQPRIEIARWQTWRAPDHVDRYVELRVVGDRL